MKCSNLAATEYCIFVNKNITSQEFSSLMEAVGWGRNYTEELVQRSLLAYPFIAHARNHCGKLCGYLSAFSDGAFSTILGELVVHPNVQNRGIGRALLSRLEHEYVGVPLYVKPLGKDAEKFFLSCGYKEPSVAMRVLIKSNEVNNYKNLEL